MGDQLPLPQLRAELGRLAGLLTGKRGSSQATSELAGLLYEAQRRNACKAWGYNGLSPFAKHELQISDAAYTKYRRAGENLFRFYPKEFEALLTAVAHGTERPRLQQVSKLEELARLSPEGIDVLQRGGSLRATKRLEALDRFGSATEDEQAALRTLDDVLRDIGEVRAKLAALNVGTMTPDGRGRILQKLGLCNPAFAQFWEELDRLAVALRERG